MKSRILKAAEFTGSIFKQVRFIDVNFDESDFEHSQFLNCDFNVPDGINSVGFNDCNFDNTRFIDSDLSSCVFTNSTFTNCIFANSSVYNSTLDNVKFLNCKFQNCNLNQLNLEFSEFENTIFDNVLLSFSQIPYIFGLLEALDDTNNKITIDAGTGQLMLSDEYQAKILPQMLIYYKASKNYFPLSNILISQKNTTIAYEYIILGLQKALEGLDIRMLKYFFKLATKANIFTMKERKYLYERLLKGIENLSDEYSKRSFVRHLGEIRDTLFHVKSNKLILTLKTNISSNDTSQIGTVLDQIYCIEDQLDNSSKNDLIISLSHNSDIEMVVTLTSILIENIPTFITLLSTVLTSINLVQGRHKKDKKQKTKEPTATNINISIANYTIENNTNILINTPTTYTNDTQLDD